MKRFSGMVPSWDVIEDFKEANAVLLTGAERRRRGQNLLGGAVPRVSAEGMAQEPLEEARRLIFHQQRLLLHRAPGDAFRRRQPTRHVLCLSCVLTCLAVNLIFCFKPAALLTPGVWLYTPSSSKSKSSGRRSSWGSGRSCCSRVKEETF